MLCKIQSFRFYISPSIFIFQLGETSLISFSAGEIMEKIEPVVR